MASAETTDSRTIPFTGVVLVGGHSRRMGRDKATLLAPDGRTWLQRSVDVLHVAGASEVLVSVRAGQSYGVPGTREISDAVADAGPLAGVAAAINAAGQSWIVILSTDLVAIHPAFIRELLEQAKARGAGIVPSDARGLQPLAAVYPRTPAVRGALAAALADGRCGVRAWAEQLCREEMAIVWPLSGRWAEVLQNANSPADLPGGPADRRSI